ncbi:DUF4143 domain-containing protein [Thiocapsa bogorovii]|nr:DUF4143 domain-containing protein [Thiocapsa bogorovii]UHD17444.1 DUF4143 domain-containing protein [Thiocapsa bogorovii]
MLGPRQVGKTTLAVSCRAADDALYLDLENPADLLLVRRLPPYLANAKKRLVKSPKVYVRDSGLVHTLLRLDTLDDLLGHPVAGMSWKGFVVETLLRAAPERASTEPRRVLKWTWCSSCWATAYGPSRSNAASRPRPRRAPNRARRP